MGESNNNASLAACFELNGNTATCSGHWTVHQLAQLESQLARTRWPAGPVRFELNGIQRMDTGGAWLLQRLLMKLERERHTVETHGLRPEAAGMLQLVQSTGMAPDVVPRQTRAGMLEALGRRSLKTASRGIGLLAFIGEMGAAWLRQIRHPRHIRWREIALALGEAGHKAIGIVGLLAFLLGIVIAYQGGVQLRQYGASLFIADLVGLSMVRELAPMITAIIVAGRTGSAYTAQIGTMQVTEEVDALRSMGIPPMDMLVLPKLLALVIALPLLTVFADIMGILGGMVMSAVQLDIAFSTYIERIGVAVSVKSYLVGLGKAPVFAAIIATIGCYQGFQVVGSAESVGRRTTISVVHSILAVIVVDAGFSVAFSRMGI